MTDEEYNAWAGTAKEPTLKWASNAPNDIMYNPGGDVWSPLTEDVLLNDPNMLNAFNTRLNTPGAAQGAYTAFNEGMSPETQAAITGLSGSSHTLAPEVLDKMWRSSGAVPPQQT